MLKTCFYCIMTGIISCYLPQIAECASTQKIGCLARPAIKKDADGLNKSIDDEIKSAKNDQEVAPKANPEDKVIEFIVSDIGR